MLFFVRNFIMCLCVVLTPAYAGKDKGPKKPVKPLPEMCLGSKDAPVTVIEYSSLTCSHCAEFANDVFPKIEKNYIDRGKIRFVFRDFPGDKVSLIAHQYAWSRGGMKYFDLIKLFYSTQEQWLEAQDPVKALKAIAMKGGITLEQCEACLKNTELLDKILQLRIDAQKKYNIKATPTFVINTKIYDHALTYKEFQGIVDPLLATREKKMKKKGGEKVKCKTEKG